MSDKKDINFQSTERQKRILPEDSFGDWKWREALAELMVPLIGSLYRNGINIMIYGKSLVNESPVSIMKAHRFVRQVDNNELSESETFPIIKYISTLDLKDCEIDIGEIAVKCPFFNEIKDDQSKVPDYINSELDSVINIFLEDDINESNIATAVSRLDRITEIQKILIDQVGVLETMTPMDFLDFRDLLVPASGFQSKQFRLIENKLGLDQQKLSLIHI